MKIHRLYIAAILITSLLCAAQEDEIPLEPVEHATPYSLEHTPRHAPVTQEDLPTLPTRDYPPAAPQHVTPDSLKHTPRAVPPPPPPVSPSLPAGATCPPEVER